MGLSNEADRADLFAARSGRGEARESRKLLDSSGRIIFRPSMEAGIFTYPRSTTPNACKIVYVNMPIPDKGSSDHSKVIVVGLVEAWGERSDRSSLRLLFRQPQSHDHIP